jgi:Heme/copper-type cytochrome/quinol oxidase, subunit 3
VSATRQIIDVSDIADHGFGSRSIMWWATVCMIAIEASVFILTIASYFYLQGKEATWPPADTQLPGLKWGTINVLILLLSLIPNQFTKKSAENKELSKVRIGMVVCDLFAIAFVIVRIFEYTTLNVRWDANAYGSVTWTLLSFHTIHLVTDLMDSIVLTVLMFTHHGEKPRRMVDVSENSFYWYFVVISWLPIYGCLYWAPRLL